MDINEAFVVQRVTAAQLDALLASGWRHFGTYFYRYSSMTSSAGLRHVQPLRMQLENFKMNRSQRRNWQRNQDLRVTIGPASLDSSKRRLFELHAMRFTENVPEALEDFMGSNPERGPCDTQEILVFEGQTLIAAHFVDLGDTSASSAYSVYDPAFLARGLGTFTILQAIEYSKALGKRLYYPGYATREPSHYDYKKRYAALEYFDWQGQWLSLKR
jgi:leucyl-tRNA---protein transferase